MQLSQIERLTLLNQFEILKRLDKTDEYDHLIVVLREGYVSEYQRIADLVSGEVSAEDCRLVSDTLAMFRSLEHYHDTANDGDLKKRHFSHFVGFDGNHEGRLRGLARHEMLDRGMWSESRRREKDTDGFNSHSRTRESYRRMIAEWKQRGEPHPLTKDDAHAIVEAAKLPYG